MHVRPFRAVRPHAQQAAFVAAVPYDVVDTAEARLLVEGNPVSFLHVSRPEVDFPEGTDAHAEAVYRAGAATLQRFLSEGILFQEKEPAVYIYRQAMGEHVQTGVVACCSIDDYRNDVIRRHEKTRQDKEDDRTRHCLILNANTGPVFLTYRDRPEITARMEAATHQPPLYDFEAADGVRHTVWKAPGEASVWQEAFARVPVSYIADGHHRAAASVRAGEERRKAAGSFTGDEEFNWFLAVSFPASQLNVLPYNRVVADLNGLSPEDFLARVQAVFSVEPCEDAPEAAPCTCGMYLGGRWYRIAWPEPEGDPVSRLDVSVLQDRLLAPVLGIDDPRTNERIAFVGGIKGSEELVRLVDGGKAGVAFSMAPVSVEQMMAIADAGQIMPPKSTWFEPKLRSGLLVHLLD